MLWARGPTGLGPAAPPVSRDQQTWTPSALWQRPIRAQSSGEGFSSSTRLSDRQVFFSLAEVGFFFFIFFFFYFSFWRLVRCQSAVSRVSVGCQTSRRSHDGLLSILSSPSELRVLFFFSFVLFFLKVASKIECDGAAGGTGINSAPPPPWFSSSSSVFFNERGSFISIQLLSVWNGPIRIDLKGEGAELMQS